MQSESFISPATKTNHNCLTIFISKLRKILATLVTNWASIRAKLLCSYSELERSEMITQKFPPKKDCSTKLCKIPSVTEYLFIKSVVVGLQLSKKWNQSQLLSGWFCEELTTLIKKIPL